MSTTPELERWQAAEQHRDQLQAELDRLDALGHAGLAGDDAGAERERLDAAITAADQECHEAELGYWRAEGDHDRADRLESDRLHADLIATNAAHGLLADLRRARGEDDPPDLAV